MRRLFLSLLLCVSVLGISGQQARKEIKQNPYLSASTYLAYQGPQKQLTKAPKGYKPFYISHYGRHGSRYLSNERDYQRPVQILERADSLGKLNALGRDVLRRLRMIRDEATLRQGELTQLGAEQHQQIATRMYERFPEVFEGDVCVDARSTVVIRCILSMANELQALLQKNPQLHITCDASRHDMYYMNLSDPKLRETKHSKAGDEALRVFREKHIDNSRVVNSLFNDTAYVRHHVSANLGYYLFKLASNLQSTELRKQMTLYDLFTREELYRNWLGQNASWYLGYGFNPLNGARQPYSQRNLLRNIIEQADSCIRLERPGATLRFGHDTMVLPLTCLLGLNGYGQQIGSLEELEKKGWIVYRIVPMAANLQFVFYRKSADDGDILFKVLLNEDEATLPLKTDCAPYYHWSDFREHYLKMIDAYEGK